MKETLRTINELQEQGLFEKYAIGGAVAAIFYAEPVVTFDLDIMVILPGSANELDPLRGVFDWAKSKGYELDKEQIIIGGIPVQFLPVYNELVKEAVENSIEKEFEGIKTFVIPPEYLAAIMLDTSRAKDRERFVRFYSETQKTGLLDVNLLKEILDKYNLSEIFRSING
jgi:hypothetical protein